MSKNRGFITVDFLFAIVIIFGFTAIIFSISFTLTVASITQYVTFAAARNYVTAHVSPEVQEKRAKEKYKQVVNNPVFAPLFKNGWFEVSKEPQVGDISRVISGYQATGKDPNLFWGVGTNFTAKILDIKIPFFGSTTPDGDGKYFKTFMGSYLGREVTIEECNQFVRQRWTAIQSLQVTGGVPYSQAAGTYFPSDDNGC